MLSGTKQQLKDTGDRRLIVTGPELAQKLNRLYLKYNRRKYLHPDPLEFLYGYDELLDREIVGMVAASLAYGRVRQILKSVSDAVGRMVPSPSTFLERSRPGEIARQFDGFCHRFATGQHLSSLLLGIKNILETGGSLNSCFLNGMAKTDQTVLPGLNGFAEKLVSAAGNRTGHLIALPRKRSPCKRLNLFLRWMVRKDAVDPGGWEGISPAQLIVPLDTHLHAISQVLGLTQRKNADMTTALDITAAFRELSPEDPVKYDFALTRFGIRKDMDIGVLKAYCDAGPAASAAPKSRSPGP